MNHILSRTIWVAVLAVALSVGVNVLHAAQIYEWDDAGGRHFADSLEAIPKDVRSQARVVAQAASSESAPAPTPAEEAANDELPTAFASGWDRGFEAGWNAALEVASNQQPVCPTEPQVVVLQSAPPAVVNVPTYDPTGAFYQSPYIGTVTVPGDQGRSMGLTRREQMQRLQGR